MTDPIIIAGRRTPIATLGRAFQSHRADELAASVLRAVRDDADHVAGQTLSVGDVILGNCTGPGGNIARVSALAAGLDTSVPAGTVDRQCGSGLAAIIDAAAAIRAGDHRVRLAGGVESASTAPVRSINEAPYDRAPFTPMGWPDPDMPRAAENLAKLDGISRARQDAYAARSHDRAERARDSGLFDAELVTSAALDHDDAIGVARPLLHRFTPLFAGGTVTAGTSTRVSDGAAVVAVAPAGTAPGLAIRSTRITGCDPAFPGIGAVSAIRAVLDDIGAALSDVAAIEIVEAFAAQSLAVLNRLGLDDDDPRVCAEGGALALGHPWGASGAVVAVRLFSRLVRANKPSGTLGVAAASIGGGMGVAIAVESTGIVALHTQAVRSL